MLNYDPSAMLYAGEELLTANLRKGKRKEKRKAAAAVSQARKQPGGKGNNMIVSPSPAVRYPTLAADLLSHMQLEKLTGQGRKRCHHCGDRATFWDPICKVTLHRECLFAYHDSSNHVSPPWADKRVKGLVGLVANSKPV